MVKKGPGDRTAVYQRNSSGPISYQYYIWPNASDTQKILDLSGGV